MFTEFNWIEAISSSPAFIALIVCSAITLAIAIERGWYYWKRSGDADATLAETMKKLREGDTQAAASTCESTRHPVGVVANEVLRRASEMGHTIEEQLQVVLSQQKLLLERNLNVLGTMAAIAPLVGLLGTVWGIMRAFHDMARVGSAAPSVVAAGVAEALVTTAAGLVVAVPALILYNHFARRMNVTLTIAENHARSVRTVLADQQSASGSASSARSAASRAQAEPTHAS